MKVKKKKRAIEVRNLCILLGYKARYHFYSRWDCIECRDDIGKDYHTRKESKAGRSLVRSERRLEKLTSYFVHRDLIARGLY